MGRILRIGVVVCAATAMACSEADPGIVGEVPGRGAGGSPTGPDASGAISTTDAGGDASIGPKCAGSVSTPEKVPLDLFIMLDQSGSMLFSTGGPRTKWEEVLRALDTFVARPDVAGIGVGLQYFGLRDPTAACATVDCTTDIDCGADCGPCNLRPAEDGGAPRGICGGVMSVNDSCRAADYSTAEVPIAPLPGNAAAISASLARHYPFSGTPTYPALEGSIAYVKAWATAHPTHISVNVFATEGVPSECDRDIGHIDALAKTGFEGSPSVRTFVIGIHGQNESLPGMPTNALDNLHGIAAAGGTDKAFMVTSNTAAQFIAALNKIRVTTLSCAYFLPKPMAGPVDVNKVNVDYTPGGASAQTIPRVSGKAACTDQDGWYYDDPANPTQIVMCDATCQALTADLDGKVEIELGCATIVR